MLYDPLNGWAILSPDPQPSVWIVDSSHCSSCLGVAPVPTVDQFLEDWEKHGPKCRKDLPFQLTNAPCPGTRGNANACFLESVPPDIAATKWAESVARAEDAEKCAYFAQIVCTAAGGAVKATACVTEGPYCHTFGDTDTASGLSSCYTDADCSEQYRPPCCQDERRRVEAWAALLCDNVQNSGAQLVRDPCFPSQLHTCSRLYLCL